MWALLDDVFGRWVGEHCLGSSAGKQPLCCPLVLIEKCSRGWRHKGSSDARVILVDCRYSELFELAGVESLRKSSWGCALLSAANSEIIWSFE